MKKLCGKCKYWHSVDSMPNWGNCHIAGCRIRNVGERLTGNVLRRYDENCCDFEPTQQPREKTAKHPRREKRSIPSMHPGEF